MKKKSPWWIWMFAPMPVAAMVLVMVPPGQSPLEAAGPLPARSTLSMERRPMPVPIPLAAEPAGAPAALAAAKAPSLPRTEAEVIQAREALKERERRLLARRAALNPVEREAIRDLIAEIRSYNDDLRAFEAQAVALGGPRVSTNPTDRTAAAR